MSYELIDMIEVERKARAMRAEVTRDAFVALAARIRGLFAGFGGQTAH